MMYALKCTLLPLSSVRGNHDKYNHSVHVSTRVSFSFCLFPISWQERVENIHPRETPARHSISKYTTAVGLHHSLTDWPLHSIYPVEIHIRERERERGGGGGGGAGQWKQRYMFLFTVWSTPPPPPARLPRFELLGFICAQMIAW